MQGDKDNTWQAGPGEELSACLLKLPRGLVSPLGLHCNILQSAKRPSREGKAKEAELHRRELFHSPCCSRGGERPGQG